MNTFFVDILPEIAANMLCDSHKNRLIYEGVQLLCNAYYSTNQENLIHNIYKKSYYNHPCSKWVRLSLANFNWLLSNVSQLLKNYIQNGGTKWKREFDLIKQFSNLNPSLELDYLTIPHLAFGATRWKSEREDVDKIYLLVYNRLQPCYKHLQKQYGVLDKKLNCYIPNTLEQAVEAYQIYYCLKEFKPKIIVNQQTGKIDKIIYQFPTWNLTNKKPKWYNRISTDVYMEINDIQ